MRSGAAAEQTTEKIGAIINPRAGGWSRLREAISPGDRCAKVAQWLAPDAPKTVWAQAMTQAGDGARFARAAIAEGCTTLVAVGGDGTINDVVQGIQSVENAADIRLGLLPMGTANVLARELHVPLYDPVSAAQIVRAGRELHMDLGRVGARWFLAVAGIGFDGAVTQAVNMKLKRRIGKGAYALAAAKVALSFPSCALTLTLDDNPPQRFDSYLILVANGGLYAGGFQLGENLRLDDGLLDVFVCQRRRPLVYGILAHALALAQNRFQTAHGIHHFRAQRIAIEAEQRLPLELDGDPAGETPTLIEIVPGAQRILIPSETI